jgi:hypothetical protein
MVRRVKGARPLAAITGAMAVTILTGAAAIRAETPQGSNSIPCTNPYSGATWQISIDYDHSTVDSNPARISETEIAWRDVATGWSYALDRKSGNLKVTLASSTGGNFLYDHCSLEK